MKTMIKFKYLLAGHQTIFSNGTDLGYLATFFKKLT